MSKINKTRYALLGVLSVQPASGYDIKKFCDKSIAHFWNENYGHIYPVLREMENEGLIAGERLVSEGKPPRTVYSITQSGREELRAWLAAPVEPSPTRIELLLKLIFSSGMPVEKTLEMLEAERKLHAAHLEEYHRIEERYTTDPALKDSPASPYWLSTLRYGMMSAELLVKWCEETIGRLRDIDGAGASARKG